MQSEFKEDGGGLRYNTGKPRYDLIPPEPLDALADHFRKGMEKYAERNWERGMSWGHCFAGAMRHLWAFWRGEDYDPETGTHHTIAAAWNCFALFTYYTRGIGEDTRWPKQGGAITEDFSFPSDTQQEEEVET